MSNLQPIQWGIFMKGRNRVYWIAGAFLWGLTSAALAEVAGTAPEKPAANTSSAHANAVRPAERPQRHAHSPRTEHAASTKTPTAQTVRPSTQQPEPSYSAALSQYQFAYGNANVPFSPQPDIGASSYAGTTLESQILRRNSTQQYGAPAASTAPASPAASDDNWRFMANPLINATHIHEIGAAVSVRHDF